LAGTETRATQLRDEAAHHASALISDVISHDGLTDGFWDHVTNFIDEHAGLLSSISKVASWVATIAGTLALAVGWIPGCRAGAGRRAGHDRTDRQRRHLDR
jgi:hypothetical protein